MRAHDTTLQKFARTPHIEGSRLQPGDDGSDQAPLSALAGLHAVIEEKLDGGQAGLSFTAGGELLLQSRGHYLLGGGRERQFSMLHPWAQARADALMARIEDRFVVFGEHLQAKHSLYYDAAPALFNEFDVFDRATGKYLSTPRRLELLRGTGLLPVPVLYQGPMPGQLKLLKRLIRRSLAKSMDWRENFEETVKRCELPLAICWKQTDVADESEGLYIKIEDDEHVLARYKFVRSSFVQTILESGSHHSTRPIVPNGLAAGVDLYALEPEVTWEDLGLQTITSIEELKDYTPAK